MPPSSRTRARTPDPLGFHDADGVLLCHKPIEFLRLSEDEAVVAGGLSERNVREWARAIELVDGFFKDPEKTRIWFQTENILLGGCSPKDMIVLGRFQKLLSFIETSLDENKR